mmetsp:Transcript_32505/g.31900  ORF Transcript_32505/g.31900 Transcript_32505/m.31900 type:complete len:116 (+) Transcript_32505:242-589(+)
MPSLNIVKKSEPIGKFKKLEEYVVDTRRILNSRTQPFGYLTEAELISQMQAHAIGRNGKIAQCIQELIDNDYVTVDKKNSRTLIPTNIGSALIKGIGAVDPELISPKIRASIEQE